MFFQDLLASSYLREEEPQADEIVILPANIRPGFDYHLVTSRADFEALIVKCRALEPMSEAVLMTIGKTKEKFDPIWNTLLQTEMVVSHYTDLCNARHAEQLSQYEEDDPVPAPESPAEGIGTEGVTLEPAPAEGVSSEFVVPAAVAVAAEVSEQPQADGVIFGTGGEMFLAPSVNSEEGKPTGAGVENIFVESEVQDGEDSAEVPAGDTPAPEAEVVPSSAFASDLDALIQDAIEDQGEGDPNAEVVPSFSEEGSDSSLGDLVRSFTPDTPEGVDEPSEDGDGNDNAGVQLEGAETPTDFVPPVFDDFPADADTEEPVSGPPAEVESDITVSPEMNDTGEEDAALEESRGTDAVVASADEPPTPESTESEENDAQKELALQSVDRILNTMQRVFGAYGLEQVCSSQGTSFVGFLSALTENVPAVGGLLDLYQKDVFKEYSSGIVAELCNVLREVSVIAINSANYDDVDRILQPVIKLFYEE